MTEVEYAWRENFRPSIDPLAAGRELERITELHDGVLDASYVVEESRPSDALLHDYIFSLDEQEAAERHYQHRARQIIGGLTIRVVEQQSLGEVRAFIAVGDPGEVSGLRQYHSALTVRDDPEMSLSYRAMLRRRLIGLRDELESWDEFAGVVEAIDNLVEAG